MHELEKRNIKHIDIPVVEVELNIGDEKNRKFTLREFRESDANQVIQVLKSEYEKTYIKEYLYDTTSMLEAIKNKIDIIYVAESKNEIVSIVILTRFDSIDERYEACGFVVKPSYRGTGLMEHMVNYIFDAIRRYNPPAMLVYASVYHNIIQREIEKRGMKMVGIKVGNLLMTSFKISFKYSEKCLKYSNYIYVLPLSKKSVGRVVLHNDIAAFAMEIYNEIDVKAQLVGADDAPVPGIENTRMSGHEDERNLYAEYDVIECGANLESMIRAWLASHKEKGWALQISLPSDETGVWAYNVLYNMGFFFTGLMTLSCDTERFYMSWIEEDVLHMEDYTVTDNSRAIRDRILAYMMGRKT